MNLRRFRIAARLSTGLGLTVAFMIALIVLGIVSMMRINERLEELASKTTVKIWYATMIQDSVHVIDNAILNMIVARKEPTTMMEYVRVMTARKTCESAMEALAKLEDTPYGREMLGRMQQSLEEGEKENSKVIELARAARYRQAAGIFLETSRTTGAVVRQVCSELVGYEKEEANASYLAATRTYRFTSFMFVLMGLTVLGTASAAAVLLTRSITAPLKQAVHVANRLGSGDLSVEIDASGRDETAWLLTAMKEMADKLKKLGEVEHQLVQSQKLETVGRLAGGIAHDFNNMLGVILGNTQLMKMQNPGAQKVAERCTVIESAVMRASDFIRQLLAFSRRQILEFRPVRIDEMVREFEKMMRRMLHENIDMRIVAHSDLALVKVDTAQISQVILNLVVNAREAMPDGGILTIETDVVVIDSGFCYFHPGAKTGTYVVLSVSDTGIGMSPEVVEKIFEPFFTTKETGTGLGLSVVYGIIRQHGGFIDVASEPDRGTRFSVYLPSTTGEAAQGTSRMEGGLMTGSGETVLIVEDDEDLRQTVSDLLALLGYRVLTACDGEEGVRVFRGHSSEIDLVLLDAVMPKKSGFEAYREMDMIRPAVPSLFVTGYNAVHGGNSEEGANGAGVIQKPYSVEVLSRRIREILDGKQPETVL
ncbi:MAG: Blue-light-activated protein [Syntrophorhabdus sp. PtaB.Bin047]|nr:MAG: Blue-light-activated protein [Syntrophorhabdus sp. PtaB.Bin047]